MLEYPRRARNPGGRVDSPLPAPYAQDSVRSAALGLFLWFPLMAAAPQLAAAAPKPPPVLRARVPAGPPPPLMKLSEVRPGMEGHALTVFQGTKPEPFKIKVISVLRNFLPKEDIILVRAED